jgi:hypothetical protein
MGRLRDRLSDWANTTDQDARDLRHTYEAKDVDTIAEAPDREMVRLRGTLRTVTLRPRGGVPALEAELFDGTGTLTLIWLGRRDIPGIAPGTAVRVEGLVGCNDGTKTLYNPRYEIVPGARG